MEVMESLIDMGSLVSLKCIVFLILYWLNSIIGFQTKFRIKFVKGFGKLSNRRPNALSGYDWKG